MKNKLIYIRYFS